MGKWTWLDDVKMWIAWRAPRWLVYWCAVRLWAHATTGDHGDEEAPAVTFSTALSRWAA